MSIDKKYILAGAIASSIMLHTGMTTAFAATEYKVITADAVNFRSGPSTSYSSLGSFNKGDKVEYLGTSGSWVQVKYDNKTGYVYGSYVGDYSYTKYVIATTLNVRKSKSTSSTKLGTLKMGTRVAIVKKESNGCQKIIYGEQYGYIASQYVKISSSNSTNRKNLNDFLFIGDSFTARIEKTIKSNNEAVYVHAQGGSRSSYWLDKVDEMPDKNLVESISILIGVNGVTTADNITNTKALINQLIVRYPDKAIYVQKVFPVAKNFTDGNPTTYNKTIAQYNKQLNEFCSTKSNVKIIDATTGFVDSKGYLTNASDGLHINEVRNSIFYKNIFNAIKNVEKTK